MRTLALATALIAVIALAGCGGNDGPPKFSGTTTTFSPAPAPQIQAGVDKAAVRVVRNWADTLRRGKVEAAARFFAVPSLIANGGPPAKVTTRAGIVDFNRGLPCGARLVRADRAPHGFVIATFVLTERPGPGTCGSGGGGTARTAFRVRDGHITDWLRVQDLPPAATTQA
jgi:hypothetical protein